MRPSNHGGWCDNIGLVPMQNGGVPAHRVPIERVHRIFDECKRRGVTSVAIMLTNDPDDAQDLVQDTFERGFKAFDSFQEGTNFAAWMTTIERNAYFNQYAKAKRRPQRANDSTGEYDDWDIYSASEHSPEELKSAEQEYLDAYRA